MRAISPSSTKIRVDAQSLAVFSQREGIETALPALWLRERTQDPAMLDLITQQRLYNPHELPADICFTRVRDDGATIFVEFSDGHAAHYERSALIAALTDENGLPAPEAWRSDFQPEAFDYSALADEQTLLRALEAFLRFGVLLVSNTPVSANSILELAADFGYVRTTNFGSVFEVYNRPGSNDLAYRHNALGPHTDNPYRHPAPGIQLLHCLANEATGGDSTLVDSLAVCDVMREQHTDSLALLSRVPVKFRYIDSTHEVVSTKPLIETDSHGQVTGLHYSPRLDYLPLLPEAELKAFHLARQQLGQLLQDPRFEIRFTLRAGDLLMFDNSRVLHGRTAFDPTTGSRHLQGCYIEHDEIQSRYRKLRDRSRQIQATI
jgi:gamma-butyrobetaine dioxygenase